MAMDPRMDRRMHQAHALSQEARVAVHILQMPMMELREYLKQEILENPMLEESTDREKGVSEDLECFEDTDNWDASFEHPGDYDDEADRKKAYTESLITERETLRDHLLWQLDMFSSGEDERSIGEEIIGNIGDDGYLKATAGDIAKSTGSREQEVERVLALIQTFDPAGVAARDLKECLLIQLKSQGKEDALIYGIVENCLQELQKKDYKAIAKRLGVDLEEEEKARLHINVSSLEPKPGRAFSEEATQYVMPDVKLVKKDEGYIAELNNAYVPVLVTSKFYSKLSKDKSTDDKTKDYLAQKRTRAEWIVNAILKRQDTIKRIATYLANYQKDFLEEASGQIRPLKMEEVAKEISMNESTVSRAVSGKYMETDMGTFPLKYFFSTALSKNTGEEVSSNAVKNRIKSIIEEEAPKKPLSDQKIADILKNEDISISRRTVAKYRESMKIPPASSRRR